MTTNQQPTSTAPIKKYETKKDVDAQVTEVIGKIDKRPDLKLQVSYRTYKGTPFIDIRDFTVGKDNQLYPTVSGVTISIAKDVNNIDLLIELLEKAKQHLQKLQDVKDKEIDGIRANKRSRAETTRESTQSSELGL